MSTTDRYRRARDLFEKAVALPPMSRATLLEIECGGDTALRAEVESLLANHDTATVGFLESPGAKLRDAASPAHAGAGYAAAAHPTINPPTDPLLGRTIAHHYRVERLIATGGMGSVYEAQQEHPKRRVALKVLRPGMSAPSAIARFRLEPEFLGRLQHPNIAQVFESGVHQDETGLLPFFAMELIEEALTLAEYVRTREPGIPDRLTLFGKICDAIQHGHQKGVIHRDIKPTNVLVSHSGEPKVIDFGVARATDSDITLTTQCTHVGDLVGTIRYMSPEQCDGDSHKIDTRSDVYSLGVLLYELLTGVPPYDTSNTTVYGAVRIIKEMVPRRPSELNKRLRGDLDAILLRALEKDAGRRYQSAAELAADVRRHLRGEPIEARVPGALTRAMMWAVRHPVAMSIGLSVCVLVLAAATGGVTYWWTMQRPHRVLLSRDSSVLRLVTATDHTIRTWSGEQGAFQFALFVDRPDSLGGGPIVILAAPNGTKRNYGNAVAVFDTRLDESHAPKTWRLPPERIPVRKIRERRGNDDYSWASENFVGQVAVLADVFTDPSDPSADELICYMKHESVTHGAICVFRLDGVLLFSVWIDAHMNDVHWVPDPGVIVCSGVNGTAPIEDREILPPLPDRHHPHVVFAVKPTRGEFIDDYIEQEPDAIVAAPPERKPLWYFCLLPISADFPLVDPATGHRWLSAPLEPRWQRSGVQVTFYTPPRDSTFVPGKESGISWILDGDTGELLRRHPCNSAYAADESPMDQRNSKKFPPYDSWSLGPLPRIRKSPTSQASTSSTATSP